MGFVQPFDDRERLGQHRASIILQRRHQALRIDGQIRRRALLALAQMVRQMLGAQPLQVQRDFDR